MRTKLQLFKYSRAVVNRLRQDLARGGYIAVTREHTALLKKLAPRWQG